MVKAKTGITLLKRLGFVLIALPEPFTTPIGVACVLASSYLSRIREVALNKHLGETLTRYLSHSKRSNDETDNKSHARQKVKPYTRTDDPTILWQNKSNVETNHITPLRQNRRDMEEKTIHHNIDTESLSRHYPVTVNAEAKAVSVHSDAAPDKPEKLIHHSVDTQFLSRRYPVTVGALNGTESTHPDAMPVETEKLAHHNVDKKSLSRRYPTTVNVKAETASQHSDTAPVEPQKLIHHSVDMQMLGRRYGSDDSSKIASNPADKPNPTENVVHHKRHVSLSRRFEGNPSAGNTSDVNRTPDAEETVQHHSVRRSNSDVNRSPDVDAPNETVQHHSINFKQLSQRYGQLEPSR